MRSRVRRIAISGLVALATVLGGVAIPATAMAQPTSGVRSTGAVAARAAGPARAAAEGGIFGGVPKISCVLATDCLAVEGTSKLSDADRHAIAVYLKSVPPIHVDLPPPKPPA